MSTLRCLHHCERLWRCVLALGWCNIGGPNTLTFTKRLAGQLPCTTSPKTWLWNALDICFCVIFTCGRDRFCTSLHPVSQTQRKERQRLGGIVRPWYSDLWFRNRRPTWVGSGEEVLGNPHFWFCRTTVGDIDVDQNSLYENTGCVFYLDKLMG